MASDAVSFAGPAQASSTSAFEMSRDTVPSLICNENVVQLGATGETNVLENGIAREDALIQDAYGNYENGRVFPSSAVREHFSDAGDTKNFGTATADGSSRNGGVNLNPLANDKYFLEFYNGSAAGRLKTDFVTPNDEHTTMDLEDLTVRDMRYLEHFPLSNSCSFGKDSVERLSKFLNVLADGDDVAMARASQKAADPETKVTRFEANVAGTKVSNVGRKIRCSPGSEPRMRDVLLHLLPAVSLPSSHEKIDGESTVISTILNYLAAYNLYENEQHRIVEDVMAVTRGAIDTRNEAMDKSAMNRPGRPGHHIAIDADLFSYAFDDLAALVPPENNFVDQSAAKKGSIGAIDPRSSSGNVHDTETLVLPPLPNSDSYAALRTSLLEDTAHTTQQLPHAKLSFRSATGERIASLVRKCLTVEIPVRNTSIFQLVDMGSTMLHAASNTLAEKLTADANSILSAMPIITDAENIYAGDGLTKSRPPANVVEPEIGEGETFAAPSQKDLMTVADEVKKREAVSSKVGLTKRNDPGSKNRFLSESTSLAPLPVVSQKKHAKKQTDVAEEIVAGKNVKSRTKRLHETLPNDSSDSMSLLKRLATRGVDTGNGKRRQLSLLSTYQPPMKSFYDLIDATVMTKLPTEMDDQTSPSLHRAENATRNLSNQLITANILGTLESMQLIRSWFMAQLLAVRAETHPHTRLAKRQALLRKYYNHLVSAYKLKKSAVRVREQASIDFDAGKKETNRVLERCKQALVAMFEDKRKLIELEKTLDIATNRYDLSRSVASTRASRKTRGGPQTASAAANADAELLLSLGAGGSSGAGASTTASSASVGGGGSAAPQQQHHTLYPDHHDILGGSSSTTTHREQQKFMSTASGRANLLRANAAAERQNTTDNHHRGNTAGFARAGSGEQSPSSTSRPQPPLFHRPQLFSSYSTGASNAANSAAGMNPSSASTATGAAGGGAGSAAAERPWLPTANTMLNFKKRRATALSQLLKTEIDEADMLSDLAYLNGSSQMMQNSSTTGLSGGGKRKRQTAIKSNVRVDSNKLMIDEHAFHRNQTVLVEPNPASSVTSTIMLTATNSGATEHGGASPGQFSATILSFSAGEIWLRRAFDGQKFKVSLGQLMDGTYKLMDVPYSKRK